MESLYLLQKKGVRFIENLSRRDSTSLHFRPNRILDIESLFKLRLSEVAFSDFKSNPALFIFKYTKHEPHYEFRKTIFIKNNCRTNYGRQLFSWQIPNLLNLYPDLIDIMKTCSSLPAFRKQAKIFFFSHFLQ